MSDNFHVSALKRAYAHLKAVGGDAGKIAEVEEMLRLAGEPVEGDDVAEKGVKETRKATPAPADRRAPARQTAAPAKDEPKGVTSDFMSKTKPANQENDK